jgi:hypothetical protein
MIKGDREFLIIMSLAFSGGLILWLLDFSTSDKMLIATWFLIVSLWIKIDNTQKRILRETMLLRSMLWQMSFYLSISEETREMIREEIKEVDKWDK